ncbi:YbhN family protein [Hydrogenophaga sp.]|uniref:lysylphosphatidylglycerol synthase transmembrane domain-containing protein n=1 Tax=Hydrogenophaga sp. TaxID=1904254 RepID=UPI0035B4C967
MLRLKPALYGFALITVAYLSALLWLDSTRGVFRDAGALWPVLPLMAGVSLLSYAFRFARWHWLLRRAGHRVALSYGFLAYLCGFAFTATPGKVGELVRIRYLQPKGVPPWRTLAAFVFERAFDLVVLVVLTSLALGRSEVFASVTTVIGAFLLVLAWLALHPVHLVRVTAWLRRFGWRRLSRLVRMLRDGLTGSVRWFNPLDVGVSLACGFIAWGLSAMSFAFLLQQLGVTVPLLAAAAIYPLAMLAGAVSMIPGGLASTEAAIVVLVVAHGAAPATAALAAVGIRLATLWFAILCGLVAVIALERARDGASEAAPG